MRFADLVTLAWIPFSLVLFAFLRPRHAVLVAYLGAWLFLPMKAGLVIPILPDIDKVMSSSFAVLLGVMLFDTQRLFTFRPRWFDLPMAAWCFSPFLSSITNGNARGNNRSISEEDWGGYLQLDFKAGEKKLLQAVEYPSARRAGSVLPGAGCFYLGLPMPGA